MCECMLERVQTMHGLEVLWQVPSDGPPAGVLFLAHGCSHSGSDWWPSSARCPHCLGLPEEVRVRRAALARGYAVVAVTSFNRNSKCWHNTAPDRSEDMKVWALAGGWGAGAGGAAHA